MPYHTIVVGYDGSGDADRAVEAAAGQVAGDARTVDAAAHHQHVHLGGHGATQGAGGVGRAGG